MIRFKKFCSTASDFLDYIGSRDVIYDPPRFPASPYVKFLKKVSLKLTKIGRNVRISHVLRDIVALRYDTLCEILFDGLKFLCLSWV